MNSKHIRKTTIALAIAFAAAAPAMAATSAPSWAAGYPVGELQDFEMPPSTRAQATVETPAAPVTATSEASSNEAPSSLAGADASVAYGENEARAQEVLSTAEVQPLVLPQGVISRESVRAEFLAARAAGTLTPANELGDTPQVLAAREAFNDEQAQSIVAEYQAEYDRRVAMQEAEIRRAAIEAEWQEYGVAAAPTSYDDPTAEVQIDVISLQPETLGE